MMNFIKKYGFTWWLGAGTVIISGYSFINWQWYAFVIPLLLLIKWSSDND